MKREWIEGRDKSREDATLVRVLQWNILSQTLGENGDFSVCPQEALQWDHRRELIEKELLKHDVDLLCLQEVDCFSHLSSFLYRGGFSGIWVPKLNSPCLKFEPNMGPDGNALFFKNTAFSLVHSSHQILQLEDGSYTNSTLLMVKLQHRETGKLLEVMITHLKAKETEEFREVRKQQMTHILKIVEERASCEDIIFCGDFNSGLDESIYSMVEKAGFKSAYCEVAGEEPEFTTWKIRGKRGSSPVGEKKRTIDFIFFRGADILPREVLGVPDQRELGAGRLPNLAFPSDHINLAATFSIANPPEVVKPVIHIK